MKKFSILAFALGITICISSCKKDEAPAIPELTPEASFSMDFSDFQKAKSANILFENWGYSVTNVTIFSAIVSANMTIPTLAFAESFNQKPTYIGDQTWQWSYNLPGIAANYTAKLNGTVESKDKVKWKMYIDKTGIDGFNSFLWFEGTTTGTNSAQWRIYEKPASPAPLFDIVWEANSDRTQSSLKYTYLRTGDDNVNSTIEFGKTKDSNFDRYYKIYLTSTSSNISINWNSVHKNGQVKSPNYYKDEIWHCWNEILMDDFCN